MGFGLAATIGGMVGQGILRTPGIVAGAVPDPTLNVALWVGVGLFCMVDACGTAELAASVPRAGGPYAFVSRAFGKSAGSTIGWADILNNVSSIAFVAIVSAEYLHRLGLAAAIPTAMVAVVILILFTGLNLVGTRSVGATQQIGSLLKGLGLILLIGLIFSAPTPPIAELSAGHPALSIAALVVAARAIKNTYDGWSAPAYFCEEVEAPGKNIPRSIFSGIVIVTALYALVNLALLHAMTPAQMAASNLPAADAIRASLGDEAEFAVSALSAISVLAIVNLYIMYGGRIAFAMARGHVLPRQLALTSASGSPRAALCFLATCAGLLTLSGTYEMLVALATTMGIIINSMVTLSALRLRRMEPALHRPFQTPFYPWPMVASLALNAALLSAMIWEDPIFSGLGVAAIAAIAIAYRVINKRSGFAASA